MKEQIYTIPVNEVYDTDCECPLCELEKKLEKETLDYALGAAMMEPEFRMESNEKGFCNHHCSMLFGMSNKLALSLVLDTHLEEIRKKLDTLKKSASALKNQKGGLFKKTGSADFSKALSEKLDGISDGCVVCDKINHTMERYADVLLYMWANDEKFKEKFNKSKGVCLKHMKLLVDTVPKSLKDSQAAQYSRTYINSHLNSTIATKIWNGVPHKTHQSEQSTKFQLLSIMTTKKNKSGAIVASLLLF